MPREVVAEYVQFVVRSCFLARVNYENGIGGINLGESVTLGMNPRENGIVDGRIILKNGGKSLFCQRNKTENYVSILPTFLPLISGRLNFNIHTLKCPTFKIVRIFM
jgi:hypothetical protein